MLRMQRVEQYLAHVQLPPLLVDDAGNVVGPVLEYNRLFLYSSVDHFRDRKRSPGTAPFPAGNEHVTVLYAPAGGTPLPLDVEPHRLRTLQHAWPETYYFESSDCSGQAWVVDRPGPDRFFPGSVLPRARIAPPGQTLYAEILREPSVHITAGSHLAGVGFHDSMPGVGIGVETPCTTHPHEVALHEPARPLRPLADLDALFTPPFRLLAQGPLAGP